MYFCPREVLLSTSIRALHMFLTIFYYFKWLIYIFSLLGAVFSLVPNIESGLPFKENTVNVLSVDVTVSSAPNGRDVGTVTDNGGDIWNLVFTLEKTKTAPANAGDRDVIETVTYDTASATEMMGIAAGSLLTFQNIPVTFQLGTTATDGVDSPAGDDATSCLDFDTFCVELVIEADTVGATTANDKFTFAGSTDVNTDPNSPSAADPNPKKCIQVGSDHCSGKFYY